MSLKVVEAASKEDRQAFLRVPHLVFAKDRNWVAPLDLERSEHLDPKKNPYFQHAEVALFVAYDGDRPVGRISAQLDRLREHLAQEREAVARTDVPGRTRLLADFHVLLAQRDARAAVRLVAHHLHSVERNLRLNPRTPDLAAALRPHD